LQNNKAFIDVAEGLKTHLPTANEIWQMSGDDDRPMSSVRTVIAHFKLIRIIIVVKYQQP